MRVCRFIGDLLPHGMLEVNDIKKEVLSMKRVVSLVIALVLLLAMASSASAALNLFGSLIDELDQLLTD